MVKLALLPLFVVGVARGFVSPPYYVTAPARVRSTTTALRSGGMSTRELAANWIFEAFVGNGTDAALDSLRRSAAFDGLGDVRGKPRHLLLGMHGPETTEADLDVFEDEAKKLVAARDFFEEVGISVVVAVFCKRDVSNVVDVIEELHGDRRVLVLDNVRDVGACLRSHSYDQLGYPWDVRRTRPYHSTDLRHLVDFPIVVTGDVDCAKNQRNAFDFAYDGGAILRHRNHGDVGDDGQHFEDTLQPGERFALLAETADSRDDALDLLQDNKLDKLWRARDAAEAFGARVVPALIVRSANNTDFVHSFPGSPLERFADTNRVQILHHEECSPKIRVAFVVV